VTSATTRRPGATFRTQNIEWQARLQGAPLASFRSRAFAFLIDAGLVALLLVVTGAVSKPVALDSGALQLSLDFGDLLSVVLAVLYFGLSTYFGKGATLGKRALGIRVVSLVHREMSLWHSIERALGYAASSLEAGFGFLQFFTHPNRQTVHDRIAETIVVVSRKNPGKR
jgi:uncharacterized RDD family membrane protein YckC